MLFDLLENDTKSIEVQVNNEGESTDIWKFAILYYSTVYKR